MDEALVGIEKASVNNFVNIEKKSRGSEILNGN